MRNKIRTSLCCALAAVLLVSLVPGALAAPRASCARMLADAVAAQRLSGQAEYVKVLTKLTTGGQLRTDDDVVHLIWLADGEHIDLTVNGTGDMDLFLLDGDQEIVAASANDGSSEHIAYTSDKGEWQVFGIVVYGYRAGAYTLRTSMSDAVFTSSLSRLSGATRYQTAIAIAEDAFSTGAGTVVIATGARFADSLAAAGLCGEYDAPLLLVPGTSLPDEVENEIESLGATQAIIVGGTGSVSQAVEDALDAMPQLSGNVSRIGGATRAETAGMIAEEMALHAGTDLPTAMFVNARKFPDALAASPLAFAAGVPIMLVDAGGVPPATLDAMAAVGVEHPIIIGGTGVVNGTAEAQLESAAGGPADRWAGDSRWDTAVAVAEGGELEGWVSADFIGVASGRSFADALGGGVAAGRAGGVLILTEPHLLPEATEIYLAGANGIATAGRIYGGPGAVWGNTYGMVDDTTFVP